MEADRKQNAEVIVYTLSYCPYCSAVKDLLRRKGIIFKEIDFGEDDVLRAKIAELSGQQTAPQVFVNNNVIGGFKDVQKLEASGELDKIIFGTS